MNKWFKSTSIVAVLVIMSSAMSFAQSSSFKAGKNLEIQTAILRTLQSQYVDSVQIDKLLEKGINAMLSSLDPYTIFISEENEEEIDMMTTGSYGGVGSIIKKLPSGDILISEPYLDSPAIKCGLQPGDRILSIDGESTKDLTVAQCSSKMRGKPGTELKMDVVKIRTDDTVHISLIRERVHVCDVVYSGFINDSIGYIQIGGFTMDGSKDVRKAVETLSKDGKMKRLVLDLRGNGGGLMSEAIDIVSLFVPSGTLVVSSRGKDQSDNSDFRTQKEPINTDIPILVMVNSGSASSSEIVSGALQDLDRATIAGTRTFGKGLVQSIRGVGYNTSLKLTTAKYYTPSGRCVQAIDYSHRNQDGSVGTVPDSLKKEFKTANGRSVYDGGGISPDIFVESKYYSRPLVSLIYGDIISDFAIDYYIKHHDIEPAGRFRLSDSEYDEFVTFAANRNFDSRTDSQIEMEDVLKTAQREGLEEDINGVEADIKALLKKVSLTKTEFLKANKNELKSVVENEIAVKYYFQRGGAESAVRDDAQLRTAVSDWCSSVTR